MGEDLIQVHPRLPAELVRRIDAFAEARNIRRVDAIKVLLASAVGMDEDERGS
jgi:hypothetical protein